MELKIPIEQFKINQKKKRVLVLNKPKLIKGLRKRARKETKKTRNKFLKKSL